MRACTTLGVPLAAVLLPAFLAASPRYTSWTGAVNLGPTINSSFGEQAPTLSKDGATLYFTSNRPCGQGDTVLDLNIWVSHLSDHGVFTTPVCLSLNVDGVEDSAAALSRDEHWMFFVSSRPGGVSGGDARDLWVTWRREVNDPDGWNEPLNAGLANGAAADTGPTYVENDGGTPQVVFASNRDGTFDIFAADVQVNGQLGEARRVPELNTATQVEARPSMRFDGLEMFFFRGPAGGPFDIFAATRPNVTASWSDPERVESPVSTEFNDQQPWISSDRETLLLASNRPGGHGGLDIWAFTRSKAAHR